MPFAQMNRSARRSDRRKTRSTITRGRSSALSALFDTLFGCEAIYLM
jgi:hypothetical protein